MAKKPSGYIDPREIQSLGFSATALKQIEEQLAQSGSLGTAPAKQKTLRAETEKLDSKLLSAIKDLTAVVKDQKTFLDKLNKSQKRSEEKTKDIEGLSKTNNSLLQKSVDLQDRMLAELKKMTKTISADDSDMAERLRLIDKHILDLENKGGGSGLLGGAGDLLSGLLGGKKSKLSTVREVPGTSDMIKKMSSGGMAQKAATGIGALGTSIATVGGVVLGGIVGTKINEVIKTSGISRSIDNLFAPAKIAKGYTSKEFPELTKVINSWYESGIPAVFGGKSGEEFRKSHNLTMNEISQNIKDAQKTKEKEKPQEEKGWFDKFKEFMTTPLFGPGAAGGPGGGAIPSTPTDYTMGKGEKASGQKVMQGLMTRGFTKEEAAVISGNIAAESGFSSGASNAIGAFGLMQWLGPRKKSLIEFAGQQGKNASDLDVQLDFIKKELKGGGQETDAFNRAMKEGGDVSGQAYLFGKYVERPADWELAQSARKRQGTATSLYKSAGEETPETPAMQNPDQNITRAPGQSTTTPTTSSSVTPTTGAVPTPPSRPKDLTSVGRAYGGKSLDGVNQALVSAFSKAAAEYKQKTGKTVTVTSGLRSTSEQQSLWNRKQRGEISYPVAKPGTSMHEKGLAIDVNSADAAAMDRLGILGKYGLNRPLPNDPVHIQLMGTKYRETVDTAMPNIGPEMPTGQPASVAPSAPAQPVSQAAPLPSMGMPGMMGGLGGMMGVMGGMGGIPGLGMLGGMGGMMPGLGMGGGLFGMIGGLLGGIGDLLGGIFGEDQMQVAQATPELANVPLPPRRPESFPVDNAPLPPRRPAFKEMVKTPAPPLPPERPERFADTTFAPSNRNIGVGNSMQPFMSADSVYNAGGRVTPDVTADWTFDLSQRILNTGYMSPSKKTNNRSSALV